MKVKDLIKELSKLDENLDVCMSSDAEGNNFSFIDLVQSNGETNMGKKIVTLFPEHDNIDVNL